MIGIYKITNKINGKYYIGQSKDIDKRMKYHKKETAGGFVWKFLPEEEV